MDSSQDLIIKEIPYIIRLYKDGRFQKLGGTDIVPPGLDPSSNVQSKDIVISHDTPLSVRLYVPKNANPNVKKLPLLIYYHGGGFIIETASSPTYHNFLNLVASESNVVIVSVDYHQTAPEHPVPTCYQDAWEAIMWTMQHVNKNGPDSWLNEYPDYENIFLAGDSAGANIAHHMAVRVGSENPDRVINLKGVMLLHPYFWGKDRIGSEDENPWKAGAGDVWMIAHPGTSGLDDPLINPDKDPKVSDLGCSRILVCVAQNDLLKDRGWYYKEILARNGWKGSIEVIEDKNEGHVFFLFNPTSDSAGTMRKRICTFINHISN